MRRTRFILVPALVLAGAVWPAVAQNTAPLTAVSTIRDLSHEAAAEGLPVKLTGVVVYVGWNHFVLHDGQAAVFADLYFAKAKGLWKGALPDLSQFPPGMEIEIEGVTDPGGFSPMVLVTGYRRLGMRAVPEPVRPSLGQLLSSAVDTQWVEVEGVVCKYVPESKDSGPACVTLMLDGLRCPVMFRHNLGRTPADLVDARVRLRGVVLDITNLRSQIAGLKLHANGDADLEILKPPPANPFDAPRVALDRLVPFSPQVDAGHRKVTAGVVSFVVPGRFFCLTDGGAAVRVMSGHEDIRPGDLVEVSGFVDRSRVLAGLSEASVRVVGRGPPPAPAEVAVSAILNPKLRSYSEMVTEPGHPDGDGALVRLTGVLRRVLPRDKDGNVILFVEVDKTLVRVLLPIRDFSKSARVSRWEEGSRVELTGVCELEIDRLDHLPWFSITGFHLWLSSTDDLRVLATPPWWTPQRLGILLAGLLLVLCLALVWGYAMRRQVAKRGRQLAGEIAAREAAALEFAAILTERRRLANDLHDTLEQALTGLALQLEIVERSKANDPVLSARHLMLARQFLERSRAEVHRTVWDLRAHGQDGRDFLDILEERSAAMVAGSSVSITVEREGEVFLLPDLVAGNLLLLAQEAVTNALKHAAPRMIRVCLKFMADSVELEVADDGRGFDPAWCPDQYEGHFGLQGLRERVKRLGGVIEILSAPGQGTTIVTRVPIGPETR
jgi:signal transduction histidine kinase